MRIALFGGRFDPPHFGHLILCRDLVEKGEFDEIRYLVNYDPPHKKAFASYIHRVRMLKMLLSGEDRLKVDTFEGDMDISPSYTYDVLKSYKEMIGGEIYFILGADQMANITSWKNYRELPNIARFVVLSRGDIKIPSEIVELFKPRFVSCRNIEISSSEIRRRLREGKSIKGLTDENIVRYVEYHHLYRDISKVEVFVDGACKGNPGIMKIGFVVFIDGKKVYEEVENLGFGTNNEAEYMALKKSLEWLKRNSISNPLIYMDSELVVGHINGKYKVKSENLKELYDECKRMVEELGAQVIHIPRERNLADSLIK